MILRTLSLLGLFLISSYCAAQLHTQTVRILVRELETALPVPGAVVVIYQDSVLLKGGATDVDGKLVLQEILCGRISVYCRASGFESAAYENIVLTAGKQLSLEFKLVSAPIEVTAVEVTAVKENEVMNEMATVSARQFSVDETNRYAGSRGDPARMASNFAGVLGADDSRNDIVIRGNSPQSVLWRLDGVDIPNPNHFNIPGTAGGPVSILNNKYLSNSDFFTGAFPADYGNSVAGVFDLRMRNGNASKHEFTGQFGFLGTELFAEGPLSKKKGSSYLANFRYSTLDLFSALKIDVGTNAIPKYWDGAFRFYFPLQRNASIAIWGIGGKSAVDILISKQIKPEEADLYGQNDRDQYFRTSMAIAGITYSKTLGEKNLLKCTIAASTDQVGTNHVKVFRQIRGDDTFYIDSLRPLLRYSFKQNKVTCGFFVNRKQSSRTVIRVGFNADVYMLSYIDSLFIFDTTQANKFQWSKRWNTKNAMAFILQPYVQLKYKIGERWSVVTGLHALYTTLGNSLSPIEPRIGVKFQPLNNQYFSLGAGRHSQIQPLYLYYYSGPGPQSVDGALNNVNMGLTYSNQLVLAHDVFFRKSKIHLRNEVYFQALSHVPVQQFPSSFSMVNTGAGFSRFFPGKLMNTGIGRNVGWEITLERGFSNGFLGLFTATLFDARYRGSDGVWRNTDFNGRYAANLLLSKEWKIGNGAFTVGTKTTTTGGRWYGPANVAASSTASELVYVDSLRNTIQFRPYFRFDIKLNYRFDRSKISHEIGIDLVNVLNTKNILSLTYAPDPYGDPNKSVREQYQLGFLPLFYYKIDF